MTLKVLFIGGTGIISSACSQLAVDQGLDLYLLNRGQSSSKRAVPAGAQVLIGDINDLEGVQKILEQHSFDVVVNWIAFHPHEVERDISLFKDHTKQYIFISSASAYEKPIRRLPITEETPLINPYWEYSRNKAACEALLLQAHAEQGFPATIVRPSHTYDKTLFPFRGGYTVAGRMRAGLPVIIHGDGTSVWVLTHHRDFAVGFNGLLGQSEALGEIYHITSDEQLTWNHIFATVAEQAGAELQAVHVPSEVVARYDDDWGSSLLGDKSHSVIFDNSKIRALVPDFDPKISFAQGCAEILAWYDADPARQVIDEQYSALMDKIIGDYGKA